MRAALLETDATELVVVDNVEIGEPSIGEVRVAVKFCGLCHSDVSQLDGVHPSSTPSILGHEAAGVVEMVGPGVTTLAVGDHVILSPVSSCGHCYYCVRGHFGICVNSSAIAFGILPDGSTRLTRDGVVVYRGVGLGAMAEFVIVGEQGAIKVSKDLPLDVVCVAGCAVQTGVGAVINTARVEAGATVLVMGAGGIGVSIVQGARLAGASRIIVSEPNAERREWAQHFGATDVIDPTEVDVVGAALSMTGVGVDYAFDAVGHSALVETGMAATCAGGTTVMVGAAPMDHNASVNIVGAMFAEKRLIGSLLGSCHAPRDLPRIVDWYRNGQLDLDAMVTARRDLSEVNLAIDDMRAGRGIRTVLAISDS